MLTATAELGDLRGVPTDFFEKYLKDMGLNAGLVIVLVVGIFILRSSPVQSGEHDSPIAGGDSRKPESDGPAISAPPVSPRQTYV
jgi:hypothetical protein